MVALVFPALPTVTLPVTGRAERFPVRRIFCVGRNYAAHARELGRDPDREPPFFFTAWAETVVLDGATIAYPSTTENFHYEAELVVAIGKGGRDSAVEDAHKLFAAHNAPGHAFDPPAQHPRVHLPGLARNLVHGLAQALVSVPAPNDTGHRGLHAPESLVPSLQHGRKLGRLRVLLKRPCSRLHRVRNRGQLGIV